MTGHDTKYKRPSRKSRPFCSPIEEILNTWWDFRKVAEFIDLNRGWLLPLLSDVQNKKESQSI